MLVFCHPCKTGTQVTQWIDDKVEKREEENWAANLIAESATVTLLIWCRESFH